MSIAFREQDRLNSRHLAIVRCRANAQKGRLCETGDRRKANQSNDEQEDLLKLERLDAYENHGNYGNYKQQPCQGVKARSRDSAGFLTRSRIGRSGGTRTGSNYRSIAGSIGRGVLIGTEACVDHTRVNQGASQRAPL